jgi:hypothetical protein
VKVQIAAGRAGGSLRTGCAYALRYQERPHNRVDRCRFGVDVAHAGVALPLLSKVARSSRVDGLTIERLRAEPCEGPRSQESGRKSRQSGQPGTSSRATS